MKLRYVSDSERATSACAHKWFLSYAVRLAVPKKDPKPYAGILWAQAMERLRDRMTTEAKDEVIAWLKKEEQRHLDLRGQHFLSDVQDTAAVFKDTRALLRLYIKHWTKRGENLGNIIASELRLDSRVIASTGNASNRTGYFGYLDKLVEDTAGDLWIVDHKLTGIMLNEWRLRNADKPQGITYCWLVQQAYPDRVVRGIIYDLALSKLPRRWSTFEKIKNGTRLAKPGGGLPFTTADQWGRAIIKNGFGYHDTDKRDPTTGVLVPGWYKTKGKALRRRDESGYWFSRPPVPVTPSEIKRVGIELYHEGTRIRRMADQVGDIRKRMKEVHDLGSPVRFAQAVAEVCQSDGANFPRNALMCDMHGRRCEFATLCREQSVEAAASFVLKEYRGDRDEQRAEDAAIDDIAGVETDKHASEGT